MTLGKGIQEYAKYLHSNDKSPITIKGYEHVLKDFQKYIEKQRNRPVEVKSIQYEDLQLYLSLKKTQGNQPVSRNRTIYVIRSFYQFLIKIDAVDKDISLKLEPIKTHIKERPYLTPEEMNTFIESVNHPLFKPLIMTFLYTGLRMSELCDLEVKDIDFDNRTIHVKHGKGNKERFIPMHEKLAPELLYYRDHVRKTIYPVFFATNKTGKISRHYINVYLSEVTRALGWNKHITAHILRHSFASALVKSNASLPAIQKLMGHSDLRITSRYIHQAFDQLQEAVNLL